MMKYLFNFLSLLAIFFTFLLNCEAQQSIDERPRKLHPSKLNQKAVGLLLKANGKRYYVSSELCPGGVFLTRPVNEHCLCYNGIFQVVRDCCSPRHTRIHSDNLEWRMDFKCGTSPEVGNVTEHRPIRAILPITKPHNRFGSVVVTRSLVGNNTNKWRKFDTEDIIVGNNAQMNMHGKTQFEIVNIKPIGREIKIMFGKYSDMGACYSGWLTPQGHQNLRVRVGKLGETKGCCFNITRLNSPGEITANCSNGTIVTEIIDVQSPDIDIGQCDQEIPSEASHTINKRNPTSQIIYFNRGNDKITKEIPINYMESRGVDDILGDRGPILFKRQATKQPLTLTEEPSSPMSPIVPEEGNQLPPIDTDLIIPRKKGISRENDYTQAQAINEFIAILRNDLNVEIREPQTPRFQMLKKSFEIFMSVVPNEIVPNMMVKTAFDVFYFLYEELEPTIFPPTELFNKTMHFLNKCLSHEEMLKFTTTGCPQQIDELIVDDTIKAKLENFYKDQPEELKRALKALNRIEIRKDKRFIPEEHDIYVDINWKVADFVHSLCFDYFGKEFNAHTYFESELETLFLFDHVQSRWLYTKRNDLRYVRGIFPVADLKLSMKQLDKVTAIGHQLSRYNGTYWLRRPLARETVPGNSPILAKSLPAQESMSRLIFAKNMLEDARQEASDEEQMERAGKIEHAGTSAERSLTYPFLYPDKLPAGEVIWDGIAICLHAAYSNSKSYFVDSDLWGVTPSLIELGQFYS